MSPPRAGGRRRRAAEVPDWLVDIPLAHQGLHGPGVPRNSLAAFEAAARAGVGIELDVRVSLDGVAMVCHDADLAHATGTAQRVDRISAEDLARLRLVNSDEPLPTLAAALDVVGARVPIMVEVKNETASAGVVEAATMRALAGYDGPLTIASFNPLTLRWFRRHVPQLLRVQTGGADGFPRMATVALGASVRANVGAPVALSWHVARLWQQAPVRARAAGVPVICWTVRTAEEFELARAGADNLIFEQLPVRDVTGSG